MCGICGIVNTSGINVEPDILVNMRDCMSYRGPDDKGVVLLAADKPDEFIWFKEPSQIEGKAKLASRCHIGLAHRRLSIIDISSAGRQPMSSHDNKIWITYNGEVYNYLQLRRELIEAGYHFYSNSDTEVIINSYRHWGIDCLRYFNGMYAFAIYDTDRKQIFLARDRVGKKPLYYHYGRNGLVFASELKAVMKASTKSHAIDHEALNFYLALGYIPGSMSIIKGVRKLPPAHACLYNVMDNTLRIWCYWQLPPPQDNREKYSIDELTDELEELLIDSVRLRLISDVPAGIFLSGGIDSSLITAAAARCSSSPVKTFTITFPGMNQYDESDQAAMIARHFKTEHHCLSAIDTAQFALEQISTHIDEPIADSSIIPTYLVSRLARQYITVALGGDGGDELFGGYTHYVRTLRDRNYLGYIPRFLLKTAAAIAQFLPAGIKGRNRICSLRHGCLQQNIWGGAYYDIFSRKRLFGKTPLDNLHNSLDAPELWRSGLVQDNIGALDRLTRGDFFSYLPDDILAKIDRASMLNSLELRTPWLDWRIVEFAYKKVPPKYKIHNNTTRIIQRKLAERMLPWDLTNGKHGFSMPPSSITDLIRHQFGTDNLQASIEPFFEKKTLNNLVGSPDARTNQSRLFALVMFGLFVSRYANSLSPLA